MALTDRQIVDRVADMQSDRRALHDLLDRVLDGLAEIRDDGSAIVRIPGAVLAEIRSHLGRGA